MDQIPDWMLAPFLSWEEEDIQEQSFALWAESVDNLRYGLPPPGSRSEDVMVYSGPAEHKTEIDEGMTLRNNQHQKDLHRQQYLRQKFEEKSTEHETRIRKQLEEQFGRNREQAVQNFERALIETIDEAQDFLNEQSRGQQAEVNAREAQHEDLAASRTLTQPLSSPLPLIFDTQPRPSQPAVPFRPSPATSKMITEQDTQDLHKSITESPTYRYSPAPAYRFVTVDENEEGHDVTLSDVIGSETPSDSGDGDDDGDYVN